MATDYLKLAGISLPNYYRATDAGVSQAQGITDSLLAAEKTGKTAAVDISKVLTVGSIRGKNDPFYLQSLVALATSSAADEATKSVALRQLTKENDTRKAAGQKTIDVPGSLGSTLVAPTSPGVAPKAPTYLPTMTLANYNLNYFTQNAALLKAVGGPTQTSGSKSIDISNINATNTRLSSTYNTALSAYNTTLAKYNTDLATYNTQKTAEDVRNKALDETLGILGQQSQKEVDLFNQGLKDLEKRKKEDIMKFSAKGLLSFFTSRQTQQGPSSFLGSLSRPKLTGGK